MVRRASLYFALTLALTAFAALSPSSAFSQAYVGVYAGPVFPETADVVVTGKFLQGVFSEVEGEGGNLQHLSLPISDFELKSRVMAGGRAGYWLSDFNLPFLGVQAEVFGGSPNLEAQTVTMDFIQTINGASTADTVIFNIREVDLNTVTVGLNLLARWPNGRIQPYGGVGLGLVYAQMDEIGVPERVTVVSADGSQRILTGAEFISEFNVSGDDAQNLFVRDSDFVAGLQLIGGLRGFIFENVALFAEYKYLTTEFEFRDIEVEYDASHIFGGIEFYFGQGFKKKP